MPRLRRRHRSGKLVARFRLTTFELSLFLPTIFVPYIAFNSAATYSSRTLRGGPRSSTRARVRADHSTYAAVAKNGSSKLDLHLCPNDPHICFPRDLIKTPKIGDFRRFSVVPHVKKTVPARMTCKTSIFGSQTRFYSSRHLPPPRLPLLRADLWLANYSQLANRCEPRDDAFPAAAAHVIYQCRTTPSYLDRAAGELLSKSRKSVSGLSHFVLALTH